MLYDGVDIDAYMACARTAYLEARPSFTLSAAPDELRVMTSGRFAAPPTSLADVRDLLSRFHAQLASTTDEDLRVIVQDTIDAYECIAERGLEHRLECLMR